MDARLDHLFVLMDSEEDALKLAGAGFPVLRKGPHRGGGTGNVVYRFRNALLELAYPIDPSEIATLGAIGFAERWRWRANGLNPLGVIVQVRLEHGEQPPFATWLYQPPFAPDVNWMIGRASRREPFYMLAPYQDMLGEASDSPIERIVIYCPGVRSWSPVASFLNASGIVELFSGTLPLMEIWFASHTLKSLDLRPCIPLVLRNVT